MSRVPAWLRQELRSEAEAIRRASGTATAAVSVYEPGSRWLRTAVNVGMLAAGEAAWPEAELYPLAEYPAAARLVREGEGYLFHPGAPGDASSAALAQRLGRRSQLGRPIRLDGRVWGELWLASSPAWPDLGREQRERADRAAVRISELLRLADVPPPRQRVRVTVREGAGEGERRHLVGVYDDAELRELLDSLAARELEVLEVAREV
jgi:hypothetical protein